MKKNNKDHDKKTTSTSEKNVLLNNQKTNPDMITVCSAEFTEGCITNTNIETSLEHKQRRNTIQHKLVLDTMLSMKGAHPSAPEIHKEIAKTYPGISNATVYSHMRRLTDDGIIRVFSCLGSADRFDTIMAEHYHIKCEKCGAVCDLVIEQPDGLDERAAKISGFLISGHNIIFNGICLDCQNANHQINANSSKKN